MYTFATVTNWVIRVQNLGQDVPMHVLMYRSAPWIFKTLSLERIQHERHRPAPLRGEFAAFELVVSNLVTVEVLGAQRDENHKETRESPHLDQGCQ